MFAARLARTFRQLRIALHLLKGVALVLFVYPCSASSRRLALKQSWSQRLLDILGVRVDVAPGEIVAGSLVVANHISWLDVFVLNAARPLAFVAKSEVREWPLIGWLAARTDTVFLRRGSRGHARLVNAEIGALFAAGKAVAVFPEGTTTDGSRLLGFHAALLQAAIESGRPIQPVALVYAAADGTRSQAPAYVGDTSLLASLNAILAAPGIVARLSILPALPPGAGGRRELAGAARAAIALSLGLPSGHRPPGTVADPPGEARSDGVPRDTQNPAPAGSATASIPAPTSGR